MSADNWTECPTLRASTVDYRGRCTACELSVRFSYDAPIEEMRR